MNTEMNQRRQNTLDSVETAFFQLIQNKALKEISVSELCKAAEINRSTFYENYDDLNTLASAWCRKVENLTAAQLHPDGDYVWLFEYVLANRDIFTAYFKLAMPPKAEDYQSAFRRRGIYAVVKAWLENGCTETADDMNRVIRYCVK